MKGMHWDFRFMQFWQFFLNRFFAFYAEAEKYSNFRFLCSLQFADFPFLSISVFFKILMEVWIWYPMRFSAVFPFVFLSPVS